MATINMTWDNTAVNASPNAIGQRVSKRLKSVGGAYDTVGFNPANDMAKTENAAEANTVTANRTYEFKVEALCTVGGPTINSNGVQEGIAFACVNPVFTPTHNSVQVVLNLATTDITKARIVLKKQSDDSTVATQTQNKVGTTVTANFAALDPSTDYYVTVELYATINGVEVISSSANYLNAVCGGNVANYQVSTSAAPACPAPADLVVGAPL